MDPDLGVPKHADPADPDSDPDPYHCLLVLVNNYYLHGDLVNILSDQVEQEKVSNLKHKMLTFKLILTAPRHTNKLRTR